MRNILLILFIILSVNKIQAQQQNYVPGLVVVKFDPQAQKGISANLLNEDLLKGDTKIAKLNKISSIKPLQNKGTEPGILSGIYKIDLQNDVDEEAYIAYLQSFSNVQYAEPYPNVYPLYVPNDPESKIGRAQTSLEQIKAYLAWDITQGDATKIIGIIDTGVDLDHEDLKDNLYLNTADPVDGIDNDGDGFIDNYQGWDFADEDNNPEADSSPHGTGVAGIAAAATDNNIGMAGIGFNTKFMPIKIFKSEDNYSRNSFEAIIYAADMGCDVINLSWGNTGRYSQYAQDIINYAVLEKDVVIVAAAGNTNKELNYFPASYDNVTSVGYVNQNDEKDPNATYSDFIDLVAPGVSIYTTQNNDTYVRDGGSSYAAPMVAGAAALLRAVHPEWNALQVMEQLRVSSDDINDIGTNSDYQYQFGKGRLNIFKALADFDDPAIRISDVQYTNGLEEAAYFGDTLDITLEFTNYLSATDNVEIILTSESDYVTVINNDFTISSLTTFGKISNTTPFKVVLSEDLPENEAINFRVFINGEFYNDYQSFQIQSSPKIRIFDFNGWHFGFTATGNIGRSYETPFSNYAMEYQGVRLLDHFGIALVNSVDSISQNIAFQPANYSYLEEFESVERLKRYNDITANLDVRSIFKEQDTLSSKTGIYVQQRLLGWEDEGEEPILLMKYQIMNRADQNLDSLYFQIFADWSVGGQSANKLKYDSATQMSYASNEAENTFVGLAVLSQHDSLFYALDIASENGHTSDLPNDTLSNELIWDFSTNSFGKLSAGDFTGGNNVASLQGVRLNNFSAGASTELTMALLTAASLEELKSLLNKAKERNESIKANLPLGKQLFLCYNDAPIVNAPDKSIYRIYDSALSDAPLFEGEIFEPGSIKNDTTFYFEEIDSAGFSTIRKRMVLSIIKPKAHFELTDQPFLLTPGKTNSYQFLDLSENANAWNWSFSNGYKSIKKNPLIAFNEEGTFDIQLIVDNHIGCKDTLLLPFTTAWRAATPQIASVEICKNDQVSLEDPSLSEVVVYSDSLATKEIYRGGAFLTGEMAEDTVFYFRNETGNYPSKLLKVAINIIPLKAKMQLKTDIYSENDSLLAIARSLSTYAEEITWFMGGEELSSENEIFFNPMMLNDKQLKLVATSQTGCSDTIVFDHSPSAAPQFQVYNVCRRSDFLIEANNSTAVYYFSDSALSKFLGKGNSVKISDVTEETKVFAINVEGIQPSAIVEVPIFISELSADFSMPKDTLNLAYGNEISITATSEVANSWSWQFGNGQQGNAKEVLASFDTPGVYFIDLKVEDSLGCTEISSKELVVLNDPLLGDRNELRKFFSIFPNPANQFIHLKGESNFTYDSFTIMDMKGTELFSKKNNKPTQQAEVISTAEFENGAYYLVVKKGKTEAAFIFIINR